MTAYVYISISYFERVRSVTQFSNSLPDIIVCLTTLNFNGAKSNLQNLLFLVRSLKQILRMVKLLFAQPKRRQVHLVY
jgi:hypothetical protein